MTISLASERWPLSQLVKLEKTQPLLVQRALQRMMEQDSGLRWSLVVSAYLDAEISTARAASLLGMHPLELRKRFIANGIPLQLGPVDEADEQAEIEAMRAWRQEIVSVG